VESPANQPELNGGSRRMALGLVTTLFFMWGFCTVLNDILVPHLKAVFEMNYVQTMLIQFTFFGSYLVWSWPSALLVQKVGYRHAIAIGLSVMGVGCLIFLPAAQGPSYAMFLVALFVLAAGMTILQVAANPYIAMLGPERTASARLNMAQGFNSVGTLLASLFGSILILSQTKAGTMAAGTVTSLADRMSDARAVQLPYLGIAAVLLALSALMWLTRLPDIQAHETKSVGAKDNIWRHKPLVMGAIAIFVYVGAEVSIGSFLINYITSPHVSAMTSTEASRYLSFYWGGAMVGRFFIGAVLMRYVQPPKILADNCIAAIVLVIVSITTHGPLAMWSILLVGLCNSVMFPTIFTLAIKGLGPLTGRGSGILVAAIFGGAVIPMLQARIADSVALTVSFAIPILCYAYIWLFARMVTDKADAAKR
jgi:FHS family L-fucose permease-like MFS transporter